jgi:hypothetical protein
MTTRLLTVAVVVSVAALLGVAIAAATSLAQYDPPPPNAPADRPTPPASSAPARTLRATRTAESAFLTGAAEVDDQATPPVIRTPGDR